MYKITRKWYQSIEWGHATFMAIILSFIIGIPFLLGYAGKKDEIERKHAYQVWVKLTNRHDITYEDWRLAKKHGLLPAQTQVEK